MPMQPVFRFAPSPNGYLHLGHARSALLNEALARELDGRLLLRIEDIDPQRSRPVFEQALLEDLRWLGLTWEEPVLRQSEHMADYAGALDRLRAEGLVYRCFCSRSDTARAVAEAEAEGRAWPRDPDGAPLHAGPCAHLPPLESAARAAAGEPHAWRLSMDRALGRLADPPTYRDWDPARGVSTQPCEPAAWGNVILARRDVPTSYHLSVVLDDARQGVSHVVRGEDLRAATAVHRVLQELLGLPAPLYHHHPLVLDEDGRKLAKSRGSTSLRDLRAAGLGAAEVRARLGFAPA
jgi:glutamyl-Q tRNA(Asp) synthetase